MPTVVACEMCSAQYQVRREHAGKKLRCKKCGHVMIVPNPADAPAEAQSAPYPREFESFRVQPESHRAPEPSSALLETDEEPSAPSRRAPGEMMVTGKPASTWAGMLVPAMFGRTTFRLKSPRVIEDTRRPIVRRHCEISLSEIDSAELCAQGNPAWLALGVLSLTLAGPTYALNHFLPILVLLLAALFITLFFVLKRRFLVVRSRGNALALFIQGDDEPYRDFLHATLSAAESARAR